MILNSEVISISKAIERNRSSRGPAAVVRAVLLALVLTAVAACKKETPRYTPGAASAVLGVSMAEVKTAVSARLDSGKAPSWVSADQWKRVRKLYGVFGNAPLWLESEGVKDRATALLKAIDEAPTHALATSAYPLDSIRRVVDAEDLTKKGSARTLADVDVLLTAAYAAYASDMLVGQIDPSTVSQSWHIPAQSREVDSAMVRTLQAASMEQGLAAMAPQDSGYQVLKDAYAQYKKIAAAGGWPKIPAIAPGRAEIVRQRLAIEGLLGDSGHASPAQAGVPTKGGKNRDVDVGMSAALKRYQEQHGLTPTGKLSVGTLEALNVPADERVQQIASNLERHRWLPRSLGARYIYVNVPAFRLEAYDSGQKTLEMKVVVGAEYQGRATPVFSDSMEYVVFRPYWNIPDKIAANEIWPKASADPGYLERGNYEVYNDHGTRRVRQRPGDKNALGLAKFMFPNDFNIYLHDTPQKALFAKTDRAASHGCIRLEHPDQLAQFVLGWPAERVRQSMEEGPDNHTVNLPRKIPVYIVYFTAYARDGQLYFGDDLYDRDEALEAQVETVPTRPDTSPPPARQAKP